MNIVTQVDTETVDSLGLKIAPVPEAKLSDILGHLPEPSPTEEKKEPEPTALDKIIELNNSIFDKKIKELADLRAEVDQLIHFLQLQRGQVNAVATQAFTNVGAVEQYTTIIGDALVKLQKDIQVHIPQVSLSPLQE